MQQSSPYNVNVSVPPSEQPKRKRGRPKKYGNVGTDTLALSPSSTIQPSMTPSSTTKKGRRRPPAGNGKYQHLATLAILQFTRKRGRPKKYGNVGTDTLALSPSSTIQPSMTPSSTPKKGRRRPPTWNGKYQHLASLGICYF